MKNLTFFDMVKRDFQELEKLGGDVPKKAYEYLKTADEDEYSHMKVYEAADLIIAINKY